MMTNSTRGSVVIVDTGCANLTSVRFAVERLGYRANISDDASIISAADKVILPGVGSARHAMNNLQAKGLVPVLQRLTQPVLGFCLGMQLMAASSTEGQSPATNSKEPSAMAEKPSTIAEKPTTVADDTVPCLSLIPTQITALRADNLRLPHMGWNTLTEVAEHPVFSGIQVGDYFYFVHSFAAPVSEYSIALCQYGNAFSAAIAKDNFIGCQFHPERSGKLGSRLINNFLELC